MRFTIAIIILAVLFASLGSGQEPASKASDDAVVYVYATKHIKGILGRVTASVLLDDKLIAKLDSKRYFVIHLAPGHHTFSGTTKTMGGVDVNFEVGKTYYLKMGWEYDTKAGPASSGITLAPPESALFDLKQLKPIERRDIRDPRVKTEP